jgi:hypothetical protein
MAAVRGRHRLQRKIRMRTPSAQFRFRAVSMELAAQLEDRRVDMLIVTEDGTTIAIECANDAILKIQQHIAQILRQCPDITRWPVGLADDMSSEAEGRTVPSAQNAPSSRHQ